ncbi:hypothetical protein M426DRAFT_322992 [Hypoxylon sp. CI-4A]|nr:hypothetical protein M426DRAFT_322992 [Hypoxylon sp. CI-4A]
MSEETTGDDDIVVATERTPLVGDLTRPETPTSAWKPGHSRASTLASTTASATVHIPTAQKPGAVLALFFLIVFAASAADAFKIIPMTRIFEDILCHEHYGKSRGSVKPIDEALCKVDVIQSRLAYLFAVQEALSAGISCLVALLWAIVADRIGRKPVYAASSIGMTLHLLITMIVGWFPDALPPRSVWVASIAFVLGGSPVMNACIYSIISDVLPESSRAIGFMRIHVTSMVGNLISPALASVMMSLTGPWPVMLLSFILWIVATAMITLIPETFHRAPPSDNEVSPSTTFKSRALEGLNQLKDSLSMIRIPSVALIFSICLISIPVVVCTLQFMVQFISKRYQVPLAKTGYVQSVYGVAHIVVVLLIIPFISALLVHPSTPGWLRVADERSRDLKLVRWSYGTFIVGSFVLGLSPVLPVFVAGLILMSLGSGSASFAKSIAATHVDAEHRSRLFTIMTLLEVVSDVWATPALAGLFTLGMRLGGEWIGLPYFGVAFTCVVMLLLSMFVRIPATEDDEETSSIITE